MDDEILEDSTKTHYVTLLSFVKNGGNAIDLEDPDVMSFTGNFRLDMGDVESQMELLALLYHSADIKTEKYGKDLAFENNRTRYFADNVLCYTCGQIGHQEKKCPRNTSPFCIHCSSEGHYRYNCPQRVCMNCYNCGHIARDCRERTERRRYSLCKRCRSGEHSVQDCPRMWRVYKLIGPPKGVPKKGCPLCLSRNHFLDDCGSRRTKFSIFSSDFYDLAQNHHQGG